MDIIIVLYLLYFKYYVYVKYALQRLESLSLLRLSPEVSLRQTIQVFIHCILNLGDIDRTIGIYIKKVCDLCMKFLTSSGGVSSGSISNGKMSEGRPTIAAAQEALELLRDFMDLLQNVLVEGLMPDCLEIAIHHERDLELIAGNIKKSNTNTDMDPSSCSNMIRVAESNHKNESIDMNRERRKDDQLRKIIRSAIRRQIEILVYIPCSKHIYNLVSEAYLDEERTIQNSINRLYYESQSYFGVSEAHQSPSDWKEVVLTMRSIQSKTLPQDKLDILSSVATEISKLYQIEHPYDDHLLGADEFLPIFIYVLIHAKLSPILTLKEELLAFCDSELRLSEMGYYTATLEASIHHILEMESSGYHNNNHMNHNHNNRNKNDDNNKSTKNVNIDRGNLDKSSHGSKPLLIFDDDDCCDDDNDDDNSQDNNDVLSSKVMYERELTISNDRKGSKEGKADKLFPLIDIRE